MAKPTYRGPHLLSGMAAKPWFKLLFGAGLISPRRWGDVAEITMRSLQFGGLAMRERRFKGAEIDAHDADLQPVFIIGHFRSGTTYLHNLMSKDPQFASPSLFDVAFPHAFLSAEGFLKPIVEKALPKTRCSDNVPLFVDAPQEDEFALGKLSPYCFYHGLYFPKQMKRHFERGVLLENPADRAEWSELYRAFLTKVSLKGEGRTLLLKNPAHSARIDLLLELFPEARFIHIHRNPLEVYRSTRRLFSTYIDAYGFQSVKPAALDAMVVYVYENLMTRLFASIAHIPQGRLAQVKYEDLRTDGLSLLTTIYETLGLTAQDGVFDGFKSYIDEQKAFQPNAYSPDDSSEATVRERWKFAFDKLGYL